VALVAGNFSDNQGGTYVIDAQDQDGTGIYATIARRTNALSTGNAVVVTATGGGSHYYSGQAAEYSGVGSTITTGTSGGGTTQPFSAVTGASVAAGSLVVSCVMANGNTSNIGMSDPPTGGTGTWVTRAVQQDTSTHTGIVAADKINGTGGIETATWAVTGTPFDSRVGIIVGYNP
jgi:hypothetical protein